MNSRSALQILLISLGLFLFCAIFAPTAISAREIAENLARSPNCTAVQCPSNMICVQRRIQCDSPCHYRNVPYCEINPEVKFDDPFTCETVLCPENYECVMKDKCEKGPCPLMPSCDPIEDGC